MSLPVTSPELDLFHTPGQASRFYAAIFKPSTVYSARLASLPSTSDRVYEISFTSGSGTLGNVKQHMDMWVGSAAGLHDLGIVRIRKTPIAGTFYISEDSSVRWQSSCYLTVVNYFDLHARHIYIDGSEIAYMDRDIVYSDQHTDFNPIPIMGGHQAARIDGSTALTSWDGSESWVIDSTITDWAWSCATASISSGTTTSVATFEFDTVGFHLIYLTVTAANGKTSVGVRYAYVYDDDHLPEPIFDLGNPSVDYETGGWSFEFSMASASVTDVPDRALVLLFREDYYGNTRQSIGALPFCENIECVGRISEESITVHPEQSIVSFRVQGDHYWMQKILGFPSGIEQVTTTPAAWTSMQNLTVDKALFHFLYWRTTATVIMDFFPTGDTRLASELSSVAGNLWTQIQEFSFATILARPGVDRFGRLFVRVDPQCVPVADRDFPNVMTIEPEDWAAPVRITRVTVGETGLIDVSGISVTNANAATAIFSLSPGHIMRHYGAPEAVDRLLLEDQDLTNEQAGLLLAWRDNEFPDIEMPLSANNPVFDCFPPQYASWTLSSGGNARGISIDGDLIPRRVERRIDLESGFVQTNIIFELATSAEAVNTTIGDIPGSGTDDLSTPPRPPAFPPLPDFTPVITPGDISSGDTEILFSFGSGYGLIYTVNFSSGSPVYQQMNGGLTSFQYQRINRVVYTPNGGVYVAGRGNAAFAGCFIAYASAIGQPFTIIEDPTTIAAKFPAYTAAKIVGDIAVNPLTGQVVYAIGGADSGIGYIWQLFVGTGTSFSGEVMLSPNVNSISSISFGFNNWRLSGRLGGTPKFLAVNSAGSSIVRSVDMSGNASTYHIPVGTTDVVYGNQSLDVPLGVYKITQNGAVGGDFSTVYGSLLTNIDNWDVNTDCDPTGQYLMADWDVGHKGKSSDYGASWTGLGSLPPAAGWHFTNRGNGSKWAAGAGTMIRSTDDWGVTWINKEGNSTVDFPLGAFGYLKAI